MRLSVMMVYAFLLMSACVTPYELTTAYQEQIVVEGLITDQPGPYTVKISKTSPITSQTLLTNWVQGASVTIADDLGNTESLAEKTPGNYSTVNFQGTVGRSYWITITTGEGSTYQSAPEELLPVGDFSNLRHEFVQKEEAKYFVQQVHSTNGFNIYLDSDVLPEQAGRVLWRWTGTYEVLTYPQFHMKVIPFALIPDPLPCSGYIARNKALIQTDGCTCCYCWVTQYNEVPILSDEKFVNGGQITDHNVAFINANVRTFFNKYHLEVEQLSVSEAVYDFWRLVQIQKQNSSTLFQTPPPKTSTNITTSSPGALPVIGYFGASSIKKHSIEMTPEDVPYYIYTIDTVANSCKIAYQNSTLTKPSFW